MCAACGLHNSERGDDLLGSAGTVLGRCDSRAAETGIDRLSADRAATAVGSDCHATAQVSSGEPIPISVFAYGSAGGECVRPAGGRVFVSTRLIAFVESEDELAAVIGHEMGHILARQASVEMTRAFKNVLGISAVGDREDILRKFNQLLDNANRRPGSIRREEDDQAVADQVSAEATWR